MNRAEEIMEEMYEEHSDQEAIRELLRKKHRDFACTDPKEKQKIYGYLVRKGFRYEDIRQVIQVCDWNACHICENSIEFKCCICTMKTI